MSDAFRVDLHVHSAHSPDSRLRLVDLVDRLPYDGLSGVALPEHTSVDSHQSLPELRLKFPSSGFIPGGEVSTAEGHLLVYGVDALPPIRRPLGETIDWVRARDGVAVLAHPLRWAHGVGRRVASEAAVDGIEAMNGHNGPVSNARAELIGARRRIALTGGSDAHDALGIGRTFTRVPSAEVSVEAVLQAIRKGRTEAGGSSLTPAERLRLATGTALRRAARGFRGI